MKTCPTCKKPLEREAFTKTIRYHCPKCGYSDEEPNPQWINDRTKLSPDDKFLLNCMR